MRAPNPIVLALVLALGLVLGAGGAALAQPLPTEWNDDTCKSVTLSSLQRPELVQDHAPIRVDGKVLFISGITFQLAGSTINFQAFGADVGDTLHAFDEGDNVRVFGHMGRESGRRIFHVRAIAALKSDLEQARDQIARARSAGDHATLEALGQRLRDEASASGDPAVRALALEALAAALELEELEILPDDLEAKLAHAAKRLQMLGDRSGALTRLAPLIDAGLVTEERARPLLEAIRAVRYGDAWVLDEVRKEREGLERHGGRWVPRARALLLRKVDDRLTGQRQNPRAGRPPGIFAEAAAAKTVLLGMNKQEVVRALGFPDAVDRYRSGPDVIEQWIYEGRAGTCYFDGGILFEHER